MRTSKPRRTHCLETKPEKLKDVSRDDSTLQLSVALMLAVDEDFFWLKKLFLSAT